MQVISQIEIEAANVESRTITGTIVPYNVPGNTSAGRVVYRPGSVNVIAASEVKLVTEHDMAAPVGRGIDDTWVSDNVSLRGSFKIVNTTAGSDRLIEAAEGLRSGLSIKTKVTDYETVNGTIYVDAAEIIEVSLVHKPAFSAAVISEVAASETETPTEPETAPAVEDPTPNQEEPPMSDNSIETPTVEASAAPVGVAYTRPRSPIESAATYVEHSIKAAQGNRESAIYVAAADDSTSTNTGLTLAEHMQEFITTTISDRPAIEAIGGAKALTEKGMSFTIPKATGYPSVAITAEGDPTPDVGATSDYLVVDVKTLRGKNDITWELLDRSGPMFYDALVEELRKDYAAASDEYLISVLTAGGTAGTGVAATAAGLQSFVATEGPAAYKGSGRFAKSMLASADQWSAILGYSDTTGRALYNAAQPYNASGAVNATTRRGDVLGLDFFVDRNIATSGVVDDSAFILAEDSARFWESGTTNLQVQLLEDGAVRVALYGYVAAKVVRPTGVRRFNLA